MPTAETIYEVPLMLEARASAITLPAHLGLADEPPDSAEWRSLVERHQDAARSIQIALVGKYVDCTTPT